MARKFLYIFAAIIVLVIAGLVVLRIWSQELTQLAFVPTSDFTEQTPMDESRYADAAMWFERPGKGTTLARWEPQPAAQEGAEDAVEADADTAEADTDRAPRIEDRLDYAVFFVHPTSYLDRSNWNAPLDDAESQRIAKIYVRGMASPFNRAQQIWAPRYRQATFGAFLANSENANAAIEAAYDDVARAFRVFAREVPDDMPIVLAGHSQGALHLITLMRREIADTPLAERVVAVYPIGWPISVTQDLPFLPFPACGDASQAGCIVSWSSYAEPADPSAVLETYRNSIGFDGNARGDSPILCSNPLTGGRGGSAPASANKGTLVPEESLSNGTLVTGMVPARCDERGLLLIGEPPEMGSAVLPGNNYHVYDIPLFWENLRQDVAARLAAWQDGQR
ncbi:DUF3089 domain-containing protein [Altererythrobacter aurantiacus]|uniref:DUF3089 domain-containing protein n=1 Tax=Parapontixanthobacter aurantiacus TaxID=1463599 RepID=A0A844ZCX3_9SPHN|nr:DUF3089 domain-containing protein [Parapontixanthobacter aurantiacus]MXO84857.1 DUF3089 domain-containing protein [Parapontixanthobacter aurantiacus]